MARLNAEEAGGANVLAFLDMLAWSEGTDHPNPVSYTHLTLPTILLV